jgi:hypothetical protein
MDCFQGPLVGSVRFSRSSRRGLLRQEMVQLPKHAMSSDDAVFWYELGLQVVLSLVAGPFFVVMAVRWARSFF